MKLAPLADLTVSGLGGWICVVAGGGKGRYGAAIGRVALRLWRASRPIPPTLTRPERRKSRPLVRR